MTATTAWAPSALDFASAATAMLSDLQHRVGLEGWWVLRRNDGEHVVLAAIDDVFGQSAGTVVSWEDSYCRLTVEQDAPPVATDIDDVPCYAQARARNGIPARSLVVVPLVGPDGAPIGILRALGTQVRPDLHGHLPTVQTAAAVLSVLLAHELQLAEQVSRATRAEGAAHTDALTGIANRRAWDAALVSEEARCARHADQAAVIVMDVNGLKTLNDTLGHQAGDQLLITTAATIADRARASDVVARLGGDEFAVLLPRTDVAGAWVLARDLQRALRLAGISVSMGVAGRSSRSGLAEAWNQADAAMYADKGANRHDGDPASAHLATPASSPTSPAAGLDSPDPSVPLPREPAGTGPEPGAAPTGWLDGSPAAAPPHEYLTEAPSPQHLPGEVTSATVPPRGHSSLAAPPPVHHRPSVLSATAHPSHGVVEEMLDLVRIQLQAQAAFITTFEAGRDCLRNLVSQIPLSLAVGDGVQYADSPGWHAAVGRTPAFCRDLAAEPSLAGLRSDPALGVASFVILPLHTTGGDLYGSVGVFSRHPDSTLGVRDVAVLRAVTKPLMRLIEAEEADQEARHQVLERLELLAATDGLQMHFQPVIDLQTGQGVGAEALARFDGTGLRPDEWFAMAASVGAGIDLELRAVSAALPALDHRAFTGFLAVNLSPRAACSSALARLLAQMPLDRLVVEITEHEEVTDYDQIRDALAPFRARGLRLAVDDTGAGYASMRHVLALVPDLIKLDISLVRDIHTDPARRALAAALTTFATATGAEVIAEGVETAEELRCLQGIGVPFGQGFHLARPRPLSTRSSDVMPSARRGQPRSAHQQGLREPHCVHPQAPRS